MGALSGYKILDFSTLLPGPYATMMLADLGADVLKVSSKDRYDLVSNWGEKIEGTEITGPQAWLGRNKKTIFLNLNVDKSIEAVKKLVKEYDIIVEQFRPGVMKKFSLDYENLKKINDKIIYCSITGYGQNGPMSMKAGHDINYISRAGVAYTSGKKLTGPSLYNFQIADVAGGSMNAVTSILAAIIYREKTGKGQYVDVSMEDSVIPFNSMDGARYFVSGVEPSSESELLNGGSIYDFYETKDHKYISVGALEPKFFAALCDMIGYKEWVDEKMLDKNLKFVKDTLINTFKLKTQGEWVEMSKKYDACIEPVMSLKECEKDEHLIKRGMFPELDVKEAKNKKIKQMGSPIKMSESPVEYKHAGYSEGYHTIEVLSNIGYSREEIKEMSGV